MGQQFEIRIVGISRSRTRSLPQASYSGNAQLDDCGACDRIAVEGERLFHRCKQLDCVDCLAQDFVQMLRQKGYLLGEAKITNSWGTERAVVDDMLKNVRERGAF
jgi:hypothetical protein